MKKIKPKTNPEQLLQPITESTEETLCGGGDIVVSVTTVESKATLGYVV